MTRNEVDVNAAMEVPLSYPNSIFSGQNTYATLFLVPAFGLYIADNFYRKLVNCYLDDAGLDHVYKRPLFLLIKTDLDAASQQIDASLLANPNFVYTYIVGKSEDKYLIMYVFECPKDFEQDYDLFLDGQYSKCSPKYKSLFHKQTPNAEGKMVESALYGVLHKTPILKAKIEDRINARLSKDQEYFGTYVDKIEIFRYQINPI